jgi:hypothetical protein
MTRPDVPMTVSACSPAQTCTISAMGWFSRRRARTTVIGTEMAAAVSAESRHQQLIHARSPLEGIGYQSAAGEFDLFRPVESATDGLVAEAVARSSDLRGGELELFRDALTQDDLYTLLTFARRACLGALRGHTDRLAIGWQAIGLVDLERVDWRDAVVAVGFLAYGGSRTGTSPDLDRAVAVASPKMAGLLRKYADSGLGGLAASGYREILMPDGPGFAQDYGRSYEPTIDLLSIARSIAAAIEDDRYRVTDITTGTDIAAAWLRAGGATAEAARLRVNACLSLSAAPNGTTPTVFAEQMFLVYLAECATPNDAALLAEASKQPEASDTASVGVSQESLCVVLIARSTVKGVASIESGESLRRFLGPLARAIAR